MSLRANVEIPPEMAPYVAYQAQGYSAKHTVVAIGSAITSVGLVSILIYVVIKLFSHLSDEWLSIGAVSLLMIFLSLLALGGTLIIVACFRAIQKPGVQLPGVLGKMERRLGLD